MEFLYDQLSNIKKNYFVLLIFLLLIIVNDFFLLLFFNQTFKYKSNIGSTNQSYNIKEKKEVTSSNYYVDIKGEVKKPGVYQASDNMIVNDVIKLAGGLTKKATTNNINLSKKITDEMVIIISSKDSLKKSEKIYNQNTVKNDAVVKDEEIAKISTIDTIKSEIPNENIEPKLVNINTASVEQLMMLSGVGKSKAEAIIKYREANSFSSINDIKNVSGIGDSMFEKIKNNITV